MVNKQLHSFMHIRSQKITNNPKKLNETSFMLVGYFRYKFFQKKLKDCFQK